MLRTYALLMQEGLQAPVQMSCIKFTVHITLANVAEQRTVAEGMLPFSCPFLIVFRFIVSIFNVFVHDAHYDYIIM